MNVYSILIHIHSGIRWLVLIFILVAIANAVAKLSRKSSADTKDSIFNRLSLIVMHLQLVLGLVLYFISPKVIFSAASMRESLLRFFLVEHLSLMVIAVILITVGYLKSENATDAIKKFRLIIVYYSIALLLILAGIPWPFRGLGAGWF